MVEQADVGWLAGMIDGDGSICASITRGKHFYQVVIYNTSEDIINKVKRLYEGMGISYGESNRTAAGKRKTLYRIFVTSRVAMLRLLLPLQPHLTGGKQLLAQAIIDYIGERKGKSSQEPYSEWDILKFDKVRSLCVRYNLSKGGHDGAASMARADTKRE